VNEEHSNEALLLKEACVNGAIDLSAPFILPFEVINGLKYTYNLGEKELSDIGKILKDFQFSLPRF